MINFSYEAFLEFDFSAYDTSADVEAAIKRVPFIESYTATGEALSMAKDRLFKDARIGVPHVLVLLTDEQATAGQDIVTPSTQLKTDGVIIFAVGLGHNYDENELNLIASPPSSELVFKAEFSQMGSIVNEIKKQMCHGKALYFCCVGN